MSTTINWGIEKLDAVGSTNVVVNAHINLSATSNTHTYTKKFVVGITQNPLDDFIPYNDLTEELVLDWVKTKLGDDGIERFEEEVRTLVTNMGNQVTLNNPDLPW